MNKLEKIKAVILGFAVGDALGVPVEFKSRETLRKKPVTEMQGYGTYNVPRGTWSDDTSMTLCTLESISENGSIYLNDIMEKFAKWRCFGYMTPFNDCFDIGNATYFALSRFLEGNSFPYGGSDERSNGNGSLMRIAPVVLFNSLKNQDLSKRMNDIANVSMLTHAHQRSILACSIYDFVLDELLKNPKKESIKAGLDKANEYFTSNKELVFYSRLLESDFKDLDEREIKSTGYVVDTLEAAIWCLLNTSTYEECVLKAVNLGEDTDTVGAIAGSLAGALYGYASIPERFLNALVKKELIENLCIDFEKIL